jgi:hypothetical protein
MLADAAESDTESESDARSTLPGTAERAILARWKMEDPSGSSDEDGDLDEEEFEEEDD